MCVATAQARLDRVRSSAPPPPAKVGFASVEIREYPRSLGDNPSVSSGPPVTLSWHFDEESSGRCTVDEWEARRCRERRTKEEFRVPEAVRFAWMRDAGFSTSQVMEVVFAINQERKERRTSLGKSPFQDRADGLAERVRRRVERLAGNRERSGSLYAEWRAAQDPGCATLPDHPTPQDKKSQGRRRPPMGKPSRSRRATLDLGMVRPILERPPFLRRPSDPV